MLKKILYKHFPIIASLVILMPFIAISQPEVWDLYDDTEYFGMIKSPYSNVVQTSLYDSYDYLYTGIWGSGVFKSSNSGKDWSVQNNGLTNLYITGLVEAKNGNIIASTMGGGIFISEDRAKTWKESNNGLNHKNVKTIVKHSNNWLIIGTYGGGVYISTDNGNNWHQSINGLYYQDINALTYSNNGYIIAGTQGGGIYASRDTGRTWIVQNTGLKNYYVNKLIRDNNGLVYAATNGRGIYNSANDGLTWSELDTFMTRPYSDLKTPLPDLNVTTMSLNKKNQVVFGTRYGGIFYYDDVEDFTWVPTNVRGTGINSLVNDKKGNNWAYPNNLQPQYTDTYGETWKDQNIIQNALNPKLFVIGTKNLLMYDDQGNFFLSNDDGEKWEKVTTLGFALNSVARDSGGVFYAASNNGLFRSMDMGHNWERIKFKDTIVHDVEVAPNGKVWVVASYTSVPNPPAEPVVTRLVEYTNDGGKTWTDVTMDLSKAKQTPKKIAITSGNRVYIGLTNFFFYTVDDGERWFKTGQLGGISNDIIDVTIDKKGRIYAATNYGLWANTNSTDFILISLFMSYNYLVHVDINGIIYGAGNYQLPNDFAYINLSYRSIDSGQTFKVLNNSYNADLISSITSDSNGNVYFTTYSGMILKSVSPDNMKAPSLISLKDKEQDVPNQAVLSWHPSENAELYQVMISTDEDFIFRFENFTVSDTSYIIQNNFEPYTKYYWKARSKNHAALSDWSETRSFVSKINSPFLIAPDSNGVGIPVYATLKWTSVDDANSYDVIVSKYSDFRDTIFVKYDYSDITIQTSLLEGLTTYYWKVRTKNKFTTSYWSSIWNFTTIMGPPLLISPNNNSIGNDINLNLVWHKATDATAYQLLIAEDSTFSTNLKDYDVTDTLLLINNLEYNKNYWWKIASKNNNGISEYSLPWQFKTGYAPVILVSPENNKLNERIPTTFQWQEHISINNYHIQIAEDNTFSKINLDSNNILDVSQLIVNSIKYNKEYFWRVRVENSDNIGIWSDIFSFKTTLDKAGLRSPANNSKYLPTELTFLWFAVNGASRYNLQISKDDTFEDLYFSQDTIATTSASINDLPNKSTLYWRVRGLNNDGYGEWSEVWNFTTSGNAPSLISPKNGTDKVKLPIVFQWNSYGDAVSYDIEIAKNEDFSELVSQQQNLTFNKYVIDDFIVEPSTTYYWRVIANMETNKSNWSQIWSFTTDKMLDVADNQANNIMLINPNPATNYINIDVNLTSLSNPKIEIMDMSGKTIYSYLPLNLSNGKNSIRINTHQFSNGTYFVKLINGKEIINGEFIINK